MTEEDIVAEILKRVADRLHSEGKQDDVEHAVAVTVLMAFEVLDEELLLNMRGMELVLEALQVYGQTH